MERYTRPLSVLTFNIYNEKHFFGKKSNELFEDQNILITLTSVKSIHEDIKDYKISQLRELLLKLSVITTSYFDRVKLLLKEIDRECNYKLNQIKQ